MIKKDVKIMKNKNYMEKIAEMYGVQLNEPFIVKDSCGKWKCKFTDEGLHSLDVNLGRELANDVCRLYSLIIGEAEIIKLPKKPIRGQNYYVPRNDNGRVDYYGCTWIGSRNDEKRYENGLICWTADEATELAKKMLEVARRRYDD